MTSLYFTYIQRALGVAKQEVDGESMVRWKRFELWVEEVRAELLDLCAGYVGVEVDTVEARVELDGGLRRGGESPHLDRGESPEESCSLHA